MKIYKILFLILIFVCFNYCDKNPISPDISSLNLKIELSNGEILLSWNKLDSDSNLKYNIYRSYRNSQNWIKIATVNNTSWLDTLVTKQNGMYQYDYALSYSNKDIKESKLSLPVSVDILIDDFDDNINRWYNPKDPEDDDGTVINSKFMISTVPKKIYWCSEGINNWEDIIFESDVKAEYTNNMDNNPAVQLLFRFTYLDSIFQFYCVILFNNSSVQLARYSTDEWVFMRKQDKKVNIYEWNKIRIKAIGKNITVYVNNEYLFQINDNNYSKGKVALAGQGGIKAYFDNVKILVKKWDESSEILNENFNLQINNKIGLTMRLQWMQKRTSFGVF